MLAIPSQADPLKPKYVDAAAWRKVFRSATAQGDGLRNDLDGLFYWAGGFAIYPQVQICNYPNRDSQPPADSKQAIGVCTKALHMVSS